jgi:parallel beta-helix repeat protein
MAKRIFLILSLTATFAASLTASEWHISSNNGDDSAAGTEQKPFQTLERALKANRLERRENPSSSRTIVVHSGKYYFEKTIHLHPQDSGTKKNPWINKAAPGANPIFIGGRSVGKWRKHEGSILKSNLSKQGLNISKPLTQLLFKGKRMPMARYPNVDPSNPYAGGFAYVAGEHIPMYQECDSDHRNQFIADKKDIHQWSRPEEMYISIFARYNWWNNIIPFKSVTTTNSTITLTKNASYAIRPNDRYFVMNAKEELDAPGEWWYDKKTSDLYFYPPSPITSEQDVSIAFVPSIVKIIRATANVRLRGITFECCESSAISINASTNCVIEKCVIRDTGFSRISGILISKGSNCGVFGCDISYTAWHGIEMNGGDRVTLTPTGHFAVNNNIHNTGASIKSGVGIRVDGVGCRIAHNWCHDMPRMGIQFSGNNHMIEYNRLHNLSLEIDDTTAIYTGGRNWLDSRGSTIRYNHITDVKGFGWDSEKKAYTSPHFSWGIYLDDNTGGVDVYGNIVEGSFSGAIHLHSSRDNHIYNNVFANSVQQQIQLSGWTADGRWLRHLDQMIKGYESVQGQPGWRDMRNMQMHPTNSILPDKTVMLGNRIVNNIIYYPEQPESRYIKMRNFNFEANLVDSNILWAAGASIITPYNTYAQERPGSSNLIKNASFSSKQKTGDSLNWRWTSKPLPESRMALAQDPDNKDNLCLQLFGSLNPKKGWDKFPGIISDAIPLKPGSWYKLTAKVKSDRLYKLDPLSIFSYKKDTYYWRTSNLPITLSTKWTEYTNTFKIPEKGDEKYNKTMTHFTPRIRFENKDGWVMVDDIKVVECNKPDSWKSWQIQGADQNSIIEDPLFEDPKSGNFRLKPESPALKRNFKQIPIKKIGQYEDPMRVL